jgi:hypothetical protein
VAAALLAAAKVTVRAADDAATVAVVFVFELMTGAARFATAALTLRCGAGIGAARAHTHVHAHAGVVSTSLPVAGVVAMFTDWLRTNPHIETPPHINGSQYAQVGAITYVRSCQSLHSSFTALHSFVPY